MSEPVDLSYATEPTSTTFKVGIPVPDGLEYLPYQKAGIEEIANRGHTYLGDPMGLGKTVQALGWLNMATHNTGGRKMFLVICPASLRINWAREAQRWLVLPDWNIRVLEARKETEHGEASIDKVRNVLWICSYETAVKCKAQLQLAKWDTIICDEAHYLKNANTKRSRAVIGWTKAPPLRTKRWLWLSGTPVANHPPDLWTAFRTLAPGLRRFREFSKLYVKRVETQWGVKLIGKNEDQMRREARATFLVRRKKEDVLPQLPAKRRQVIELPLLDAESRGAVQAEAGVIEVPYEQAATYLENAKVNFDENLAQLRKRTALAKVPQVVDHIISVLESEQKVIVFAHHVDVVLKVALGLHVRAQYMTGDTSMEYRQMAVDAFQNDPKTRVIIGTYGTMGVGFTLTAASTVIFAEQSWLPSEVSQAEDRAHRIGQLESVLCQHLVLEKSLDAIMIRTVIKKQRAMDAALDGGE